MTTDTSAAERAQTTASTAADEGRHVAGVAKEHAASVASEAAGQARNVVSDAVSQVGGTVREQTSTQRDRLVSTISTFGDDLSSMADQGSPGLATDVARQVADKARSLTSQLEGREPQELLEDVRRFARQRPGTFLLGALAAGIVAGRLLRGTGDAIAGAAATQPTGGGTTGTPAPEFTSTPGYASTPEYTGSPQFTHNPTVGTSLPGQPTQDPTPTTSFADEAGYSGGGLSADGRS
jgi:hypothetical protein